MIAKLSATSVFFLAMICLGLAACSSTSYTDDSLDRILEQADVLQDLASAPCFPPWADGVQLKPGEKIAAYRVSSTCSSDCESQKILRTCQNGVLTGPNEYMFPSCRLNQCKTCKLPWGPTLLHGQSISAYKEATAACDLSCQGTACGCEAESNRGSITCNDGELIGAENFSHPTCTAAACSCPNPWTASAAPTPHGETLVAYKSPSVPCVKSCNNPQAPIPNWCAGSCAESSQLDLLCQNGVYVAQGRVWALNELFKTCQVSPCNNCSAGSASFEHGHQHHQVYEYNLSNPNRWNNGVPPCDSQCSSIQGSAVCVDGAWWGTGGGSPYWQGFLTNPSFSCAYPQANCQCELPWGGEFMPHGGAPREVYSADRPASCNDRCDSLKGEVTCSFGVLQGETGFIHQQCLEPEDNANCFCINPWDTSQKILHGNALSPVYEAPAPQCNQSCTSELYNDSGLVYCLDGAFTTDLNNLFQTCDAEAADCDCAHPGGSAFDPIREGETRTFWKQSEVPCVYLPGTCSAASAAQSTCESQQRTCTLGELSGSSEFIFEQCQVDCKFCNLPNQMGELIEQIASTDQECHLSLSAFEGVIACGETCASKRALVYCRRNAGEDTASLQFVQEGNPYNLGMNTLIHAASACADPIGICTTGGNPTRACSLPGEWSMQSESQAAGWYRSNQERPPHTRFPWSGDPDYWTKNYLENYKLFVGLPNQAEYPYGLRKYQPPQPPQTPQHEWFYQVSPQTIMTFYDRPIVDQSDDPNDHCDDHAIVKRCHPDGFWYPLNEPIDPDALGLGTRIGPSIEPAQYKQYQFTSCRTLEPNQLSWVETEVDLFTEALFCLISQNAPGACLFPKNPFADGLGGYASSPVYELEARQRFGISWYDSSFSGLLQSSSFRVAELFIDSLFYGQLHEWQQNAQGVWELVPLPEQFCKSYGAKMLPDRMDEGEVLSDRHRIPFAEATRDPVVTQWIDNPKDYPTLRVQLFYGLEYMTEKLIHLFGSEAIHFQNRSLNVIQGDPLFKNNAAFVRAYDPFLVFGPEIALVSPTSAKEIVGRPFNYDLSVVAHELGHANLYFASGIIENGESEVCGTDGGVKSICCETARGCIRAIDEGQADFVSNIIFPDSPAVGDGFSESDEGLRICGIARNAERNAGFVGGVFDPSQVLTFQQAFDACSNAYRGQIHAMGSVYASIWWTLRNSQQDSPSRRKVERLFLEHLKFLDSASDFCSTRQAVSQAEAALWQSQALSNAFNIELQRRDPGGLCD